MRILVVDDNLDAAELLGEILRLDGHAIWLAQDAHAALDAARRFRPDVAILDIGMHGMNGFDLARAMRTDPLLAAVRLVALTGWASEDYRRRAREAGFDAYLVKPAGIDDLRAHLHQSGARAADTWPTP